MMRGDWNEVSRLARGTKEPFFLCDRHVRSFVRSFDCSTSSQLRTNGDISCFEKKIQATLARIWGEEKDE
jgi:hypothetical protein